MLLSIFLLCVCPCIRLQKRAVLFILYSPYQYPSIYIDFVCIYLYQVSISIATRLSIHLVFVSILEPVNHPVLARTLSARTDQTNSTRLYILLAVSFLGIIIVLSAVFVLLRRRKIYGGFYLFSQPPDPDYFRDIDPSRALIEQTNGLPYDPVWEFPRKRIRLRKFLI